MVQVLAQVRSGHSMEGIPMLVDRRVFMVKGGKMDEVLELLKAEQARVRQAYNYSGATRNYASYVGTFGQLVLESEWNDLAEWEAFWSEWGASPEGIAFQEEWGPLLESGGRVELWTLVE